MTFHGGCATWSERARPAGRAIEGTDTALSFSGVTVTHDGRRILDDLTFTVRRGSMVAITGPDGAGKTTAIEIALGIHHVERGAIRLLGLDPSSAVASGRVGALLASSGFPDGARVGDLLRVVRTIHAAPLPMVDLVARTGLDRLIDRPVDRLSAGEAQQLRLAVAVAGDPDILLLDEPFAGLDVRAQRIVHVNLERFRQEGRTVVIATNRLEAAAGLVDGILHLDHGRLRDVRAVGSPDPSDGAPHGTPG